MMVGVWLSLLEALPTRYACTMCTRIACPSAITVPKYTPAPLTHRISLPCLTCVTRYLLLSMPQTSISCALTQGCTRDYNTVTAWLCFYLVVIFCLVTAFCMTLRIFFDVGQVLIGGTFAPHSIKQTTASYFLR